MTHCRWLIWHVSHRPYPFIISFLLLCTIISVSSKVPLTPTYDSLFMAHPAIPRDDLSASSRLLPIHTSSNQPIRELIEWDWHYPITIHYSTHLVENPKFALNTAPHQTQLFRQKWTYQNPKRVISFQILLSYWSNQKLGLKAFKFLFLIIFYSSKSVYSNRCNTTDSYWVIPRVIFITQNDSSNLNLTQKLIFSNIIQKQKS